jgi:hypothetical protein
LVLGIAVDPRLTRRCRRGDGERLQHLKGGFVRGALRARHGEASGLMARMHPVRAFRDVRFTTVTATETVTVTNDVSGRVRVAGSSALRRSFVAVRVTVSVGVWPSVS